ncbi:MAG: helix-turn-helix domain-containing protein [Bacteroides sp.]|nr:helix-turn-helix domain-containing protein [Bacteroides sp.]
MEQTNPELALAWQFIEHTGTHLFLTGKAGTGKTTFLRKLREASPKRMVVVAPTGIAAINAGGVTLHSFFQLPFAPYVPDTTFSAAQTPYKFGKEKIAIIRSLDLLVIDEISMVRADLLDAMDAVLRRYRDRYKPFGGVQLLMIGDMQQLAPVVKEEERTLLSTYYDTSFFFGSRALRETDYVTIELKTVYRQSDTTFLSLLNRIRSNRADDEVLRQLNSRYLPGFRPAEEEGYIRLTSHNHQAQRYNESQLAALPGGAFRFVAQIEGTFPETAYPADQTLVLKAGAQIMFIKNDTAAEKRYYNGKIGRVMSVDARTIVVKGNDAQDKPFVLDREEWSNSRYTLNEISREITEEIDGVFRQYPIRLAWAITIHKSQGLTFERAIIDANASFAHGQVYVALSRCKTLEGMVLSSLLRREAIICDDAIEQFNEEARARTPDEARLQTLQQQYFYELLCEQFDFKLLERHFSYVLRLLDEHLYKLYPKLLERYKLAHGLFLEKVSKVADTFKAQYTSLLISAGESRDRGLLDQRIVSGAGYFHTQLEEFLVPVVKESRMETDNKEVKKKLTEGLEALRQTLRIKQGTLEQTAAEGFSVTAYLRKKAVLALDQEKVKEKATAERRKRTAEKIEVSSDILHPELYRRIMGWRSREAVKLSLPVYTIIQQKAVLGIVNLLPSSADELVCIPYFGKKGVDKYGDILLQMVDKYVSKHQVARPETSELPWKSTTRRKKEKEPKPPREDTKEITYRMFREGKTVAQIAEARELVTGTIAAHLEHYVRSGQLPVEEVVEPEKIRLIRECIRQRGLAAGTTALKVALGDKVSFADIRLVVAAAQGR